MSEFIHTESIDIDRPPEQVYELVSDITRTGEWSPQCRECWWDEGAGPVAGSWFTGRNQTPARTWETRSLVTAADPGREFTWIVGGKWVRWSYSLAAQGAGTRLTESWEFLLAGREMFAENYGDQAAERIAQRTAAAHSGIPETLATIKRIAES